MSCDPEALRHVPLFALLDEEETAVLAGQVELKKFAPRQRIYKMGDATGQAYVMVSGRVRVTTLDQDHQEVVVDEPAHGEFFGFASMLEQTPHQTTAIAIKRRCSSGRSPISRRSSRPRSRATTSKSAPTARSARTAPPRNSSRRRRRRWPACSCG